VVYYLYLKSLAGLGLTYFCKGEKNKTYQTGEKILEYSLKRSNIRGMVLGYYITGFSYILNGDCPSAIECGKKAVHIAADPFYSQMANDLLVYAYFYEGNYKEAQAVLNEILSYSHDYGCELLGTYDGFIGFIQIVNGDINLGYKRLEKAQRDCLENEAKYYNAIFDNTLGMVLLNIVESLEPNDFATNISWIIRPTCGSGNI